MAKLYLGTTEITPALALKESRFGATLDSFLGKTDANGVLQNASEPVNLVFSGVTDIADYALNCAFTFNTDQQITVSFPDLEYLGASTLNTSACYQAFRACMGLTAINLQNLKQVLGAYMCYQMFYNCNAITSADLRSLEYVNGNQVCREMFSNCPLLASVNVDSLISIKGNNALRRFLYQTQIPSLDFKNLSYLEGTEPLYQAIAQCPYLSDVYFRALTTNSFGTVTAFSNMCDSATGSAVQPAGCVLHFPSNLQSTIANLTGYPNFGGFSVTCAFDLPATE